MGIFENQLQGAPESYSSGDTAFYDPLDFRGQGAQNAAREAAQLQLEGTRLGIDELRAGREQAFEALSPFREAGAAQLGGLGDLISDPNAQRAFIEDNPFFESLANQAQSRLFANQAARGKVGSGGTAAGLQNELLTLGNDLLSQNINQRFNLATLGANAAAGQATGTLSTGRGISDLLTQGANAQAAGVVGASNAQTQSRNQLLQLGAAIYASDRRVKKDIDKVGNLDNGLPVYQFKYKGTDRLEMGVMAQDVEIVNPDAVIEINGIKHVDYAKVA